MHFFENKPVLAIESSGELCGASVYQNEFKFSEINLRIKHIHSEKILEIVDIALNEMNVPLSGLSAIAISSGPGSFTGLRIGMSAAKGLALGAGLPLIPVPTFEALALQISAVLPDNSEFIIANKVNVEETYFSKFRKSGNAFAAVEPVKVLPNEECIERGKGVLTFGNLNGTGNSVLPVSPWPSSLSIARWSYLFGKDLLTYDYDFLEPFYLKNFVIKEHK